MCCSFSVLSMQWNRPWKCRHFCGKHFFYVMLAVYRNACAFFVSTVPGYIYLRNWCLCNYITTTGVEIVRIWQIVISDYLCISYCQGVRSSRPASIVLSGKLSSNVLLCSIANISVPKVIYLFIWTEMHQSIGGIDRHCFKSLFKTAFWWHIAYS